MEEKSRKGQAATHLGTQQSGGEWRRHLCLQCTRRAGNKDRPTVGVLDGRERNTTASA